MNIRTCKYKLLLKDYQYQVLNNILEEQRILYNAALQERIDAYEKFSKSISKYDQQKSLTEIRRDKFYSSIPVNIQRGTLNRLHNAFIGFFNRLKTNKKAGFPRFRSFNSWKSFSFDEYNGIQIKNNRIKFKGLNIRFHKHRELPPDIKSLVFKKEITGWYVCIQVEQEIQQREKTGKSVGVDLGLKNLATTSNSEFISNIRPYKKLENKIKKKQQEFSSCKKGTKRRKRTNEELTRLHLKIKNRRATYLHQVSAKLVREYDEISIEKLNINKLIGLDYAKSIYDVGWGILIKNLRYKAASAGVLIKEINPAYTSQICNNCGCIKKLKLSDRIYECDECGFVIDRDVNAALNIAKRGCNESHRNIVGEIQ